MNFSYKTRTVNKSKHSDRHTQSLRLGLHQSWREQWPDKPVIKLQGQGGYLTNPIITPITLRVNCT